MPYLKDTFAGTAGTALSAHVPDSGRPAVERVSGAEEMALSGTGTAYVSTTPSGAEYRYPEVFSGVIFRGEYELECKTDTGGASRPHLNLIDASATGFRLIPFSGTLYLQTANGGTTVGSQADAGPSAGQTHRYRLEYDPASDTVTGWNLTSGVKLQGTNTTTPNRVALNTSNATAGSATTGFHAKNLYGRRVYFADDTTRADNASSVGTPGPYGGTWTASAGTWGIASNRIYSASAGANEVLQTDTSQANAAVEVKITALGTDARLVFRFTDTSNYLYLKVTSSAVEFRKVESGSDTSVASQSTTVAANDYVRVSFVASKLVAEVNGTAVLGTSSSFNTSATRHGLGQSSSSATRFTDFSVLSTPDLYSTVADGNKSTAATWAGDAIPGASDTPTIKHAVTVDTSTTWPNVVVNGPTTVGSGATLTLNLAGNVVQGNVAFTVAGGGTLAVVPTGNRKWLLGTANNQTACKLAATGTANGSDPGTGPPTTTGGNHATVTVDTTAGTFCFDRGDEGASSWSNTTGYDLVYCDLVNVRNSAGTIGLGTNSAGDNDQVLRFCTFDNCGTVFEPLTAWAASGNKNFRVEDCRFTDSPDDEVLINAVGTTGSGTRAVLRSSFEKSVFLRCDGPADGSNGKIEYNYFDVCPNLQNTPGSFKYNTVRYSANSQTLGPSCDTTHNYLWGDLRTGPIGNVHYMSFVARAGHNLTINYNVFEFPWADVVNTPDCVFGDLQTASVKYNLVIPSATDGLGSGCLLNPGSGYVADWAVAVEHNTVAGEQAQLVYMENERPAGIFATMKSNLLASPSTSVSPNERAFFIWDQFEATGENSNLVSPANATHNYIQNANPYTDPGTSNVQNGWVTRLTAVPTGPTTEVTGTGFAAGPDFVAPTRNAAEWAVSIGLASGGATLTQKIDATRDRLKARPQDGDTMRQWVRAGFIPRASATRTGAHDGTVIGAVQDEIPGSSGAAAVAFSVSAASVQYAQGAGASAPAFSAAGSGSSVAAGAGASAVAFAGAGEAGAAGAGAGASSAAFAASAAGSTTFSGAGAAAVAFAPVGVGFQTFSGAGAAAVAFAPAGVGASSAAAAGTSPAAFSASGAAAGASESAGASAAAFSASGAGSATTSGQAVGTSAPAFGASAAGASSASAPAASAAAFSAAGAGQAVRPAAGASALAFDAAGSGQTAALGAGSGATAVAFAGAGAGAAVGAAAGSAAPTFGASAAPAALAASAGAAAAAFAAAGSTAPTRTTPVLGLRGTDTSRPALAGATIT